MRALWRLTLASMLLLVPLRAEAAFGVLPGVAGTFPVDAEAPDVMVGGSAFYEVLPWLVARGGAYTGGSLWHFPVSLGYVFAQKGDFQLRPRLELGLDPWYNPADAAVFGSDWHMGIGIDYLPWDNHWTVTSGIQIIWGRLMTQKAIEGQQPPAIGQWLVRAELGVGYKF